MDAPLHRHVCEVAFGDTDASGWMHFPNIFRYFEQAEHAFLKSCGVLVFDRSRGGWPRVKVSCDYKRPLLTGERVEVLLAVSRFGASSITWDFEVLNASGETAAFGSVTTVRVNHEGRPQLITAEERAAIEGGSA
ncbi:MAG: acyl-CoA thioesterase [Luteolibacter sp.]|jgi:acyl-CoA thioesterase FadM|nr:acyl-CoA thioesterase [Luteolibacter sp.]